MIQLVIDNGDEATVVVVPDVVPITLQIAQMYEPTYGRAKTIITGNTAAAIGDDKKIIEIDASVGPVTYTIDPALFNGLTFVIKSSNSTQAATVAALTGVIELKTGIDQTSVDLQTRETIRLYVNGTNLEDIT